MGFNFHTSSATLKQSIFWFPETSSSYEKQATGPGL
jgi:hypothetical protein